MPFDIQSQAKKWEKKSCYFKGTERQAFAKLRIFREFWAKAN
ncbi:hypothetical protein HMPREF0645_0499 [Hallella bergensis DSM 17361]|uniref:Uncharacterized protein n=1 Tax=Hallella bergensis DSM 17361 TaxID=585502 RepID=D1PU64_9BACT|nr:hypothetical protein HMPREF0645_0499 [Hallella bergensis DSM 17361]